MLYAILDNLLSQLNVRIVNYENLQFKKLLDADKLPVSKVKFLEKRSKVQKKL